MLTDHNHCVCNFCKRLSMFRQTNHLIHKSKTCFMQICFGIVSLFRRFYTLQSSITVLEIWSRLLIHYALLVYVFICIQILVWQHCDPDPTKVNSVTLWSVSRRPGSNWGAERRANVGAWSGRLRVRHRANLQHITTDTDIFTALEFQVIISSQCHDHWLGLLSLKPRQCSAVDREQRKTSASCWGKVQCDIWDGFLQIGKSRFSVHMTPHHCRHVQPRSSRLVLMFCLKLRCDDRQTSLRTTLVHWLHKDA